MNKRPKIVWAIRPYEPTERICPNCGADAVYASGILTDEEYKRRWCRDCGHEFTVEDVYE